MPNARLIGGYLLIAGAVLLPGASSFGQAAACPVAPTREASPADVAYGDGDLAKADELYRAAFAAQPHEVKLGAGLVRTELREGKIAQAAETAKLLVGDNPHGAAALTAFAEVQFRQGQPWLATETLDTAAAADPCNARTHLIRARILRADSMHASERKEIQSAYDIDPTDPDIRSAWHGTVLPANDVMSIEQTLATAKGMTPEEQKTAEASAQAMVSKLSDNSMNCEVAPTVPNASLTLLPSMQDGKHIDAYRLEVQFPQTKALLQVDTAASGLFISRAVAEANGLKSGEGALPGTVHVDRLQIGPLEVRNCTVGVSEAAFPGKTEGFIGTDIFASYLITLDYPQAKLVLEPLPPMKESIPGDRPVSAELQGFVPVYHKQQYLLIPTLLNNKERRLFVLDTGIRYSTMTSEVAHGISTTKMNFTNSAQTASGATLQIYRDSFDFEFADLDLRHRAHILEFDPLVIERSAGLQIGGMLGFDMLHSMTMQLDYRDGLVKLKSSDPEIAAVRVGPETAASATAARKAACPHLEQTEYPTSSTIEAATTDFWDSGHVKAGGEFTLQVTQEWNSQDCRLMPGARLYGHVTAAASSKGSGTAQLGVAFDHGDCYGKGKKELSLKVIGLVGTAEEGNALHNSLPTQMSAGGRQLSATVDALGNGHDQNLNPGGTPATIHPGMVLRIPAMKLDLEGGPACSALMTTSNKSVKLSRGTDFLVMLLD